MPKVSDWELSRELIEAHSTMSQVTPEYVAPEHLDAFLPEASVDERTDVYQLGLVCYELLTETRPSHLGGTVTPPTELNDALPDALDDILLRALNHDPNERFKHPLYFERALDEALANDLPVRS